MVFWVTKMGVVRFPVFFLIIDLCSANGKLLPRPFEWLNIGLVLKVTKIRSTPSFFKIELCSTTSMESSRREFLNDMAERRPILKNNQITYPRLGFTPKTGIAFPKTGFCFYCAYLFGEVLSWQAWRPGRRRCCELSHCVTSGLHAMYIYQAPHTCWLTNLSKLESQTAGWNRPTRRGAEATLVKQ